MKFTSWQQAIYIELDVMDVNKTWDVVPFPPGKTPISYNWVFKLKLNSDGKEDIYMHIPQGYKSPIITNLRLFLFCKLNKSIYALKQASRSWFTKFSNTFLSHNYKQSKFDYSCG